MKTGLFVVIFLSVALSLQAAEKKAVPRGQNKAGIGVRLHNQHEFLTDIPFGDDDYSYGLAYEYHEGGAYWQIAIDYAPDVSGTNVQEGAEVDKIITPQINLIFEDRMWIMGVGVLKSYIDTSMESDWSDLYWQGILGIHIPLAIVEAELQASYTFESWSKISDFNLDDVDYVLWLKHSF